MDVVSEVDNVLGDASETIFFPSSNASQESLSELYDIPSQNFSPIYDMSQNNMSQDASANIISSTTNNFSSQPSQSTENNLDEQPNSQVTWNQQITEKVNVSMEVGSKEKVGFNTESFIKQHNSFCSKNKVNGIPHMPVKITKDKMFSLVNGLGTKYYPPTSKTSATTLFTYQIPLIYSNILLYMDSSNISNERSYYDDLLTFLSSNIGIDIICDAIDKIKNLKNNIPKKLLEKMKTNHLDIKPLTFMEAKDKVIMPLNMYGGFARIIQKSLSNSRNFYNTVIGPSKFKTYNALFNRAVEEVLNIKIHNIDDNCSYIKIQDVLSLIVKALKSNIQNFNSRTGIRLHFSYDGRNIPWGNVAFYLVPIDFPELFPPQKWDSAFTFIIFNGGECIDDYIKYCCSILDFTKDSELKLKVDDEFYTFIFVNNPDLKAIRSSFVTFSLDYVKNLKDEIINNTILELCDESDNDTISDMERDDKVLFLYKLMSKKENRDKNFDFKDEDKQIIDTIEYADTEEYNVKKLDLIICYLKENDKNFRELVERSKQKNESTKESKNSVLSPKSQNKGKTSSNSNNKRPRKRADSNITPPKKKQKTSNTIQFSSLSKDEQKIILDALEDLKQFLPEDDKYPTQETLPYYLEGIKCDRKRICHICCAKTKHIKFSALHPFYKVFQKRFKYNTFFNISTCAYCTLHATQRMVEHALTLTTQQNEVAAQWMVIIIIYFFKILKKI